MPLWGGESGRRRGQGVCEVLGSREARRRRRSLLLLRLFGSHSNSHLRVLAGTPSAANSTCVSAHSSPH